MDLDLLEVYSLINAGVVGGGGSMGKVMRAWAVVGIRSLAPKSNMGQMKIYRKSWFPKKSNVPEVYTDEKVIEVEIRTLLKKRKV